MPAAGKPTLERFCIFSPYGSACFGYIPYCMSKIDDTNRLRAMIVNESL
jgi:hypothetical protein